MRYILLSMLVLLLITSCDGGNEPPWGFGNSGPVVDFSAGCGEREVWCAHDDDIGFYYDKTNVPTATCGWDCGIYTGDEKVQGSYPAEGPASYMVVFKQKADGCWEVDNIYRSKPQC